MDSIEYLEPDNINGLNLYCYCGCNPVMRVDYHGTNWWSDFWNSTVGKVIGTILVVAAVVVLSIVTCGVGAAVTTALGSGFLASVIGGAVGGAISGAIFGAGISMISQGCSNGYANIDYGKVGLDTLFGMVTGAISGAVFAIVGRGLGLLGKTKFAQRTVDFNNKKNFLFGSKNGDFTIFRYGKSFRIEASIEHGLHMHYQTIKKGVITIGRSVHRTKFIYYIYNTVINTIISSVYQSFQK